MTKMEMKAFRQKLLELGQRLQGSVDALADETFHKTDGKGMGNLSNIPVEDQAELGSNNYDEGVTIGLLEKEGPRLGEINAALERIDKGTFGRCEECSQEISRKRLRAIPFARRCIGCARKAQQGEALSSGNL
jgi:RNA polymerase-binding transcription factor DksA